MSFVKNALTVAAVLLLANGASAAETKTLKDMIAVWQGAGVAFKVSESHAYFTGVLDGRLFAEDDAGALREAEITCPGTVNVALQDGKQAGSGHCIIQTSGGETVYSNWQCIGQRGVGCAGVFLITGGTGKFKGAKGEAELIIRSSLDSTVIVAIEGRAAEAAHGLMSIKGLKLTMAAQ